MISNLSASNALVSFLRDLPRPGALSWEMCFDKLDAASSLYKTAIRNGARQVLAKRNPGDEVGSSDVNHAIFAAYRRCNGDLDAVLTEFVDELSA